MPAAVSGLASGMDTDAIIQKLVEAKSQPIKNLDQEMEMLGYKKEAWRKLIENCRALEKASKKLYSFDNVFGEHIAETDEHYLTANPSRTAQNGTYTIEIKQIASQHRINTKKIPVDAVLPSSQLDITVNGITRTVLFSGGGLEELAEAITADAEDIVTAKVYSVDADNSVLSIIAQKSGADNAIHITEKGSAIIDTLELKSIPGKKGAVLYAQNFEEFETSALLPYAGPENTSFQRDTDSLTALHLDDETESLGVQLQGNTWKEMRLPSTLRADKNSVITFRYRTQSMLPSTTNAGHEPSPYTASNILPATNAIAVEKRIGSATVKNVTILGAPYSFHAGDQLGHRHNSPAEEIKPVLPAENERIIGIGVAYKSGKRRKEYINHLTSSENEWREGSIALSDVMKNNQPFDRILLCVDDPNTVIVFDDITIRDTTDHPPEYAHEINPARDSIFSIDGITFQRPIAKDINDAIPGVGLSLKRATKEPLSLLINYDIDSIQDALDEFVSTYNETMEFLNEFSSVESGGTQKTTDASLLAGEATLMNLKSRMKSIIMNAYPTDAKERLALLSQLGISAGSWGSSWENVRKGILSIEQSKIEQWLEGDMEYVAQLFGNDVDEDLRVDTGVAYTMNETLHYFTQSRGILDTKMRMIDSRIENKDKTKSNIEDDIVRYEESLRRKFGRMEANLAELNREREYMNGQIQGMQNNK